MPLNRRPGRPPVVPYHPNLAAKFTAECLALDVRIGELEAERDAAFTGMLKSGMTTYQIAKALGVREHVVRYRADRLHVKRRRVAVTRTNTVIERLGRAGGSTLFGD